MQQRSLIPLVLCFGLCSLFAQAQGARMNEAAAKEAVYLIMHHSGLLPNFTVREDPQVRSAVAFIKGRERVIAYNSAFVSSMIDSSRTDRAAVSILAHEIAHHLLGHTLDPSGVSPGDELACDHYSGFILQRMGASLNEARGAMEVAGDVHGTQRHPPRHARLAAIEQGWTDADRLARGLDEEPFAVERAFRYVVHLVGDANTYYVDAAGCLVWFNDHATPIEFGACTAIAGDAYSYELTWQDFVFVVDGRSTIWRRTAHGMPMQVGEMRPYASAPLK